MTNPASSGVELPDMDLLRKFDVPAPRYTSYPTADRFHTEFGVADYEKALAMRAQAKFPAALAVCARAVLQRYLLLLRLQQNHYARPLAQC